ncbi:MAG: NADH-quinone oxidoreductase subunit H [Ignavibacteriales bacterium]|nr:NADH-quinone oxidoreductase subunit H [Ignavibacteriales bacterium]
MVIVILQGIASVLILLGFAPLFAGLVNKQKAKLTGRVGAPILQPYYDLQKLFKKETINASTSSFISRVSPLINFITLIVAAAMLPVGFWKPLISFNGDIILFAYILGLSRFFKYSLQWILEAHLKEWVQHAKQRSHCLPSQFSFYDRKHFIYQWIHFTFRYLSFHTT